VPAPPSTPCSDQGAAVDETQKGHKAVKEVRIALRRAPIVLAVVAVSCAIAACGSSSSSSSNSGSRGSGAGGGTTTTASSSAGGGFVARRAQLAACLKQHGVTLPQFRRPAGSGASGSGVASGSGAPGYGPPAGGFQPGARRGFFGGRTPSAKMQAALKACGANFGARSRRFRTLARPNIAKYVTCVRQHGYNLPAPNFSGKGRSSRGTSGPTRSSGPPAACARSC